MSDTGSENGYCPCDVCRALVRERKAREAALELQDSEIITLTKKVEKLTKTLLKIKKLVRDNKTRLEIELTVKNE